MNRLTRNLFLFLFIISFSSNGQTVLFGKDSSISICSNKSTTITLQANLGSSYYLWNTWESTSSILVNKSGIYWVTYFKQEVLVTDTFRVTETSCETEKAIFIPTAFSPNEDGINDNLKIFLPDDIELINFSVFDRRGNVVFNSNSDKESWDGRFKGVLSSVGNYPFFMAYRMKGQIEILSKRGIISLIK